MNRMLDRLVDTERFLRRRRLTATGAATNGGMGSRECLATPYP
jgi:hypothetical protein